MPIFAWRSGDWRAIQHHRASFRQLSMPTTIGNIKQQPIREDRTASDPERQLPPRPNWHLPALRSRREVPARHLSNGAPQPGVSTVAPRVSADVRKGSSVRGQAERGNDGKITLPYWNWISRHRLGRERRSLRCGTRRISEGSPIRRRARLPAITFPLRAAGSCSTGPHRTLLTGIVGELRRRRIAIGAAHLRTHCRRRAAPFPTVKAAKRSGHQRGIYRRDARRRRRRGRAGGNRQFAGGFEHRVARPRARRRWRSRVLGAHPDGQMRDALFSPQDPIFWLFHCNVDRLWSRWQWFYDKGNDSSTRASACCRAGGGTIRCSPGPSAANAPPYQFNVRVKDVLNAANFSSAVNVDQLARQGLPATTA